MAERPDLEYWVPKLAGELVGRAITGLRVAKPVVVRQAVSGELDELARGTAIQSVARRGNFVHLHLGGPRELELVISPMLAGRFELAEIGSKARKELAVAFELDDGRELRYRDEVSMGKVYVLPAGDFSQAVGFERVGLDILDPEVFTFEAFAGLADKRRDQVRVFLMDKSAIDCLGNAYADEVLFAAGIHPKTWVRKLSQTDLERLHRAIIDVTREAAAIIVKEKPALDVKLRDFLKVRNRHKQPCPSCGTAIRKAGVRGYDSFFCPSCQPETRKSSIVDWRKTKR
ncbi:MAG: endonuclease VIII [Deltaproteobacteria bacterium]|nr:endonuclease VIII [Deltaproteobacteria bacterium]